jgi:hypothetical protein
MLEVAVYPMPEAEIAVTFPSPTVRKSFILFPPRLSLFCRQPADRDMAASVLCILNAWLRCDAAHCLVALRIQPLQHKLLTHVHLGSDKAVFWALECVAVLTACCPDMSAGRDEMTPIVAKIVSYISAPLSQVASFKRECQVMPFFFI